MRGSLIESVQALHNVGLLVIDEYVTPPTYVQEAQSKVLTAFGHLPTWAFTLHHRPLREGLPTFPEVINKSAANAFVGTGLYKRLTGAGIRHLVVLGYHVEACVAATIGHVWYEPPKTEDDIGAVNLGFTVHTHLHLIHAGKHSHKRKKPLWLVAAQTAPTEDCARLFVYSKI